MRLFQLLAAALLLVFGGTAYAQSVWIVDPDNADTVNSNGFTIVAKAQGAFDKHLYIVHIEVINSETSQHIWALIKASGTVHTNDMEIISPRPNDLDGTSHKALDGELPIVAQVGGDFLEKGDNYYLKVELRDSLTGEVFEDIVQVQTR